MVGLAPKSPEHTSISIANKADFPKGQNWKLAVYGKGFCTVISWPSAVSRGHFGHITVIVSYQLRMLVLASQAGFEPATRCLEGSRSVH